MLLQEVLCQAVQAALVRTTSNAGSAEFEAVDSNHDGVISRSEWVSRYGSADGFEASDVNGDGASLTEKAYTIDTIGLAQGEWIEMSSHRWIGPFEAPSDRKLPMQQA